MQGVGAKMTTRPECGRQDNAAYSPACAMRMSSANVRMSEPSERWPEPYTAVCKHNKCIISHLELDITRVCNHPALNFTTLLSVTRLTHGYGTTKVA